VARHQWSKLVLFVVILAIPVTLLSTTPTAFLMKGYLPGGLVGEDAVEHLYFMWWYYQSLMELGQSPANLTLLAHPTGFYNPYITAAPLVRLIALPFMGWADPTVFYNVYLLLTFVLTWVTMSLLCFYLTHDFEASVLGGFVFAFSPHRLLHASAGRITMVTTFVFPLLALALLSFLKNPTWRKAGICGVLLAISLAIDLNVIFYFTAPFVLIIIAYQAWKHRHLIRTRAFVYKSGLIALIPLLIQGPLFFSFVVDRLQGRLDFLQAGGTELYSADLLAIILPPPEHPLTKILGLNEFAIRLIGSDGWTENIVYVGLCVLPLILIGIFAQSTRDKRMWLSMSLIGGLFLLGPRLRVGGATTSIPLPYKLFTNIPFLEWGRTPARFGMLMMFGVAVLVAYGATVVFRRLRRPKWRPFALMGLLCIVWLDYGLFLLPKNLPKRWLYSTYP
jgi:hypothetical protein